MKNLVILDTIEDVIKELGGQTKLAARLGVRQPTVFRWKQKKRIPDTQVIPVMLALSSRGYLLSAKLLNIRGVSGALFAQVYQEQHECTVNGAQKEHNQAQCELELFQSAAE